MKDVREEMQEVMNQNADFARQLEESERDRAQLTARIGTLQVTTPRIDDFLMFLLAKTQAIPRLRKLTSQI